MKQYMLLGALAFCCMAGAAAQEKLSLTQAECRQMALQNNEDLRKSDITLRKAQLDKEIAFRAYLPKLDGMVSGTYMFPDMNLMGTELQMHGMYMAGLSVTQPLYAGGRITAGNKLARIGQESAAENLRKTRMEVLAEADKAYWTYIAVGRKVRMLEAYRTQMDTLYRQVETAVQAGMGTDNELLRIRTKRSEISYQLQKARNGADLCRLSLCHVLGQPMDTEIVATDTLIQAIAPTRLDENIASRPELRLLLKQVEAREQQVKSARGDILPQIGLSAGYTWYGNIKLNGLTADAQGNYIPFTQKLDDGIGLVMASVSIPLFHWGEGLKKVKKAKLDLVNARLDLQQNARLLSIEARQAVQNLTDGYNLVQTAELGSRQAEENLRVMRDRYAQGLSTLTDLLDAQSQWQQAESNRIEALAQYKIYETEYLRCTGRLEDEGSR
nr:TolC family protein [uncultured Bacteroides sp.]